MDLADKIGEQLYRSNWERIKEALKALDPDFAQMIVEIPYGSIYPRTGLEIKEREIVAVTALTCLGLKSQLKTHIIGSLNIGVSIKELTEIFIHLSMFIGFPKAMEGLKVLKEIKEEKNL